jgi:hypothetical protein
MAARVRPRGISLRGNAENCSTFRSVTVIQNILFTIRIANAPRVTSNPPLP